MVIDKIVFFFFKKVNRLSNYLYRHFANYNDSHLWLKEKHDCEQLMCTIDKMQIEPMKSTPYQ